MSSALAGRVEAVAAAAQLAAWRRGSGHHGSAHCSVAWCRRRPSAAPHGSGIVQLFIFKYHLNTSISTLYLQLTNPGQTTASKPCGWGLLLRRETGRPASRSAFVQVVGLAHCLLQPTSL